MLIKWVVILLSSLCIQQGTYAQLATASEYKVKAVFLFNFTHFIDWPEEAFEDGYSPFVIGMIGGDPFGTFLEQAVSGERINAHVIRIERYDNIQDIKACHILYVNTRDPEEIKRILAAVSNRSILTVGDTPNFIRWGGMVRFYTQESKIKLEINNTLARSRQLKISSKLLRVATVQ